MKAVYKLHIDCGRQGALYGAFVAEKSEVESLVTSKEVIYFGEALGKHSDIAGALEEKDFTMITDDPAVVEMFEKFDLEHGYNPFDFIE